MLVGNGQKSNVVVWAVHGTCAADCSLWYASGVRAIYHPPAAHGHLGQLASQTQPAANVIECNQLLFAVKCYM